MVSVELSKRIQGIVEPVNRHTMILQTARAALIEKLRHFPTLGLDAGDDNR